MFSSPTPAFNNRFSSPPPSFGHPEEIPLPPKDLNSSEYKKAVIRKATACAQGRGDRFAHVRHRSFCGRMQQRGNPQPAPHVTIRGGNHVTSLLVPVPGSQLRWIAVGRASKKAESHKMACRVFFNIMDMLSLSEPRKKDGTYGRLDPRSRGNQGAFPRMPDPLSSRLLGGGHSGTSSNQFSKSRSPTPMNNIRSSPPPMANFNSQSNRSQPSSTQSSQVAHPNQLAESDDTSLEMARNVVNMYVACLCLPQLATRVSKKGPPHRPTFSFFLATFLPDRKTRIIAKGVGRGKKAIAEDNAYIDMYKRLQRDPRSNIIALRNVFTSTKVMPESILQLTIPQALRSEISQLVEDFKYHESCGVYSSVDVMLRVRRYNALTIFAERDKPIIDRPALSARLRSHQYAKSRRPSRHRAHREGLPIFAYREKILNAIEENQVVVISGETGSGKTTQIPQYIFEKYIQEGIGGKCNIITTQPRRISAISVARRVAEERGERMGDTIGYQVRLEHVRGSNILFCTAGVLLRLLNNCSTLSCVSHIIMDEVHERAINSDFLLIILKNLINVRKDIKLIVMSATLHTKAFSEYFWDAPVIELKGRCFPVKEFYLSDIKHIARESNWPSVTARNPYNQRMQVSSLNEAGPIDYPLLASLIAHISMKLFKEGVHASILVFLPGWKEIIDTKNGMERMPVTPHTTADFREFSDRIHNPNDKSFKILPLHSSLTTEEQQQIFNPSDCINIILSTNIAETGITIGNIRIVIDCGQVKEKSSYSFSVEAGRMTQLLTRKISKANAIQRQGRAGRTQDGTCYKLFNREDYEAMDEFQTPEIKRIPLDQVVLQIISLKLGSPKEFLEKALEPPTKQAVQLSIARLTALKAIIEVDVEDIAFADPDTLSGEKKLELTPLGFRMALLPVEPHSARMILMSCIYKCLDPILTLAAASETGPWIKSNSVREEVDNSKTKYSNKSLSDHIAVVNVYNEWASQPRSESYNFCKSNYLSVNQISTLSKIKSQFYSILKRSRFLDDRKWAEVNIPIPIKKKEVQKEGAVNEVQKEGIQKEGISEENIQKEDVQRGDAQKEDAQKEEDSEKVMMEQDIVPVELEPAIPRFVDESPSSVNSSCLLIIKGLITAGLFPNICLHREKRIFSTISENQLMAHPSSVLKKETGFTSPWFVFKEKGKSAAANKVYARDMTNAHPFAILLMTGAELSYAREFNLLLIHGWIPFLIDAESAELVLDLHKLIGKCIQKKFQSPMNIHNNNLIDRFVPLVIKLLDVGFRGHPNRQGRGKHRAQGTFGFVPMKQAPPLKNKTDNEKHLNSSTGHPQNIQHNPGGTQEEPKQEAGQEAEQEPEQEPEPEPEQEPKQEPEQEPNQIHLGEIDSNPYSFKDDEGIDENDNANPYLVDVGKRKVATKSISPGIKKLKIHEIEKQILELKKMKAQMLQKEESL